MFTEPDTLVSTPTPPVDNAATTDTLDCLFVQPPHRYKGDSIWRYVRSDDPPIGLMSLTAYAKSRGYNAEILDCNLVAPELDQFEAYIREAYAATHRRPRIIGFTTTVLTVNKAFELAEICKKVYPDSMIVYGGPHATFRAEECLANDAVDVVVFSEGEHTLDELLQGKELKDVDGIAYKMQTEKGNTIVTRTKPRKRIDDLDVLPFVDYKSVDLPEYRPILGSYKRLPAMMMVTSRGCPWTCSFCRGAYDNKVGFRTGRRIFEEITYLVENHGIKEIMFMDDVFTINKKNVHELCDLLIEHKTDLTWVCFARVDIVDLELLQKMKNAGCHQIMYGVENFDQDVLDSVRKKITQDQVFQAIAWTKEAKLDIRVCFMVGLPGDTEEILDRNIELLIQLDPDYLVVNIAMPLPGTSLYAWAEENNLLSSTNWDDYYGGNPIIELDTLSPEDIKRFHLKMITSFYLRPKYILKRIKRLQSPTEIKMLAVGFFRVLVFALTRLKGFFTNTDELGTSGQDAKISSNQPETLVTAS